MADSREEGEQVLFRRLFLAFMEVMVVVAGLVLLQTSLVTAACFAEAIFEELEGQVRLE